ncbi:MAG TPA: TIR domain-containing protein [Anaerolineales bacterium]|nr:TIR domain-containing protein [Anaerolineales bacterium]
MNKIFISYAHKDGSELAELLHERLTDCGYDVWKDSHDLGVGTSFPSSISDAIKQCDDFILVLSPEALRSTWVDDEKNMALVARRHLLPVVISGTNNSDIPLDLQTKNYIEMKGADDWEALNRLVNEIKEGRDLPRVFSMSKQTNTSFEHVLLLGRSEWADENPENQDEISDIAKKMWKEYLSYTAKKSSTGRIGIIPPGYAPLALAFLAYIVGKPNELPRLYYPAKGPDGGFRVSADVFIELQSLRDSARNE